MVSRFVRFFVLAVVLIVVPSFVYISQQRNGFIRDPVTGEYFSEDSYIHGIRPAQVQQGHAPKGATTPAAPAAPSATQTLEEPAVAGAYAHKMANATAKYVTLLTLEPNSAERPGISSIP